MGWGACQRHFQLRKIVEQFRLRGICGLYLVQPLLRAWLHLIVEQVAHGHVPLNLEHLQGWNHHILSGILLSCLIILLKNIFFSLCPIPCCNMWLSLSVLPLCTPEKSLPLLHNHPLVARQDETRQDKTEGRSQPSEEQKVGLIKRSTLDPGLLKISWFSVSLRYQPHWHHWQVVGGTWLQSVQLWAGTAPLCS